MPSFFTTAAAAITLQRVTTSCKTFWGRALLAGAERVDQSKSPEWPLKTVTFFYLPSPKLLRDVFMVLFDRKKSQKYLTVIFTDNGRKSCFAKGRTLLFIRPFIFQIQWLFPRLTVLQSVRPGHKFATTQHITTSASSSGASISVASRRAQSAGNWGRTREGTHRRLGPYDPVSPSSLHGQRNLRSRWLNARPSDP